MLSDVCSTAAVQRWISNAALGIRKLFHRDCNHVFLAGSRLPVTLSFWMITAMQWSRPFDEKYWDFKALVHRKSIEKMSREWLTWCYIQYWCSKSKRPLSTNCFCHSATFKKQRFQAASNDFHFPMQLYPTCQIVIKKPMQHYSVRPL